MAEKIRMPTGEKMPNISRQRREIRSQIARTPKGKAIPISPLARKASALNK